MDDKYSWVLSEGGFTMYGLWSATLKRWAHRSDGVRYEYAGDEKDLILSILSMFFSSHRYQVRLILPDDSPGEFWPGYKTHMKCNDPEKFRGFE